jgi:hypothetical protein
MKWQIWYWDETDGEDYVECEMTQKELIKFINQQKYFTYAISAENKELIHNNKPRQEDWIAMREAWGLWNLQ